MNNKSAKLRVTNKKLKAKLKEYRRVIFLKDNANLSLIARKDADYNLISHLETIVENQENENKHLEKENTVWQGRHHNLLQERLDLEMDLEACKRNLASAKAETVHAKQLTKKYEENVYRLSKIVAKLAKENETLKGKSIANKVKNIFKKR